MTAPEEFDPLSTSTDGAEIAAREKRVSDGRIISNHVAGIPAFTLLTNSQYVMVSRYVQLRLGLSEGSFVVNRYGLPFMPIPKPKSTRGGQRYSAIPRQFISTRAVVHPIYWTSPEVLGDVPEDTNTEWAQEWSIRMFSFLMLCGLISEDYTVKNYLAVHGIPLIGENDQIDARTMHELRVYFDASGAATRFDSVPNLTFDSIIVDPTKRGFATKEELYTDFADKMVAKCAAVFDGAVVRIGEQVSEAVRRADEYIFQHIEDDEGNPTLGELLSDFDAPLGQWAESFGPMDRQARVEFRDTLRTNGYQTTVQSILQRFAEGIEQAVSEMDNLSSVLIGPVMARDKNLDEEAVMALQSYNRAAVDTVTHSDRYGITLKDVLASMDLGDGSVTFDEDTPDYTIDESERYAPLDDFLAQHTSVYEDAWKRLFLCRANYDSVLAGRSLYNTFGNAHYDIFVRN